MKRLLAIALLAIAASACGTLAQHGTVNHNPVAPNGTQADHAQPLPTDSQPSAPPTVALPADTPQPPKTGGLAAAVAFIRADVQAAHDDAAQFNEPVGLQCHAAALAVLDVALPNVKVAGVASGVEALRIKQRAFTAAAPLIRDAEDKCAGVYNIRQLMRPIFDALGL